MVGFRRCAFPARRVDSRPLAGSDTIDGTSDLSVQPCCSDSALHPDPGAHLGALAALSCSARGDPAFLCPPDPVRDVLPRAVCL